MPNENPDVTFSETSSLDQIPSEKFKMMNDPFVEQVKGGGSAQILQPTDQVTEQHEESKQDLSLEQKEVLKQEALELQKKVVVGMPTRNEMEEGRPGAINKHRKWERTNKEDIDRYLELRDLVGRDEILSIESLRLP